MLPCLQYEKSIIDVVDETKNLPEALAETGEVGLEPEACRLSAFCLSFCVSWPASMTLPLLWSAWPPAAAPSVKAWACCAYAVPHTALCRAFCCLLLNPCCPWLDCPQVHIHGKDIAKYIGKVSSRFGDCSTRISEIVAIEIA